MTDKALAVASPDIHLAFHYLLAREARLLDEYCYTEWMALMAPEVHYSIPARRSHHIRDHRSKDERKFDTDHYADDHESLLLRTMRLSNPAGVSSNDPRPREIRVISNIEVFAQDTPETYRVNSVIQLIRNRMLDDDSGIAGRREDIWRGSVGKGFLLVNRTVWISQNTILMPNMASIL
jgi:3-phenylpropionate/cinnamic acid dioxygenase small subunit